MNGSNAFAVDLYAQLRTQPGNLFFSPESISTAFAMAYAGARGQTATEMEQVFHFTLPPERLHPAMGALLAEMNAPHKATSCTWPTRCGRNRMRTSSRATSSWSKPTTARASTASISRPRPKPCAPPSTQWVEKQTNDKIQNLLGPGVLTPATRLVLTNAIYFKGDWLDPFDEGATQKEEFHLSATQWVDGADDAPHRRLPLLRWRHVPGARTALHGQRAFDGGSAAEGDRRPAGARASRSPSGAAGEWIEKLEPVDKVILTLPRFTMTQQFELSSALSAMGMPQAFSGAADFSGMTGKPDFTISAAIHKAYIDVNEQGTEAAAATSIVMRATAMRVPFPEPPPIVFRADHPFLFLIRDTRSGSMLFLGRVADPTK